MSFHIEPRSDAYTHIPHHVNNAELPGRRSREAVRAAVRESAAQAAEIKKTDIEPIVLELEKAASLLNRKLKFSINQDLQRVVVKVIDANTDKVIKELPPEELQRLSMKIRDAVGLIIDKEI
ncbi:MAG: flagellar protein FlaG [Spirochaetaceae bacterium]|nr:MAG: flagellar protein FlaG [Spirochaetaceae bacterium]